MKRRRPQGQNGTSQGRAATQSISKVSPPRPGSARNRHGRSTRSMSPSGICRKRVPSSRKRLRIARCRGTGRSPLHRRVFEARARASTRCARSPRSRVRPSPDCTSRPRTRWSIGADQRVVRAAEDHRVDLAPASAARSRTRTISTTLSVEREAALDHRREVGSLDLGHGQGAMLAGERPQVGPAADRGGRREHADLAGAGERRRRSPPRARSPRPPRSPPRRRSPGAPPARPRRPSCRRSPAAWPRGRAGSG